MRDDHRLSATGCMQLMEEISSIIYSSLVRDKNDFVFTRKSPNLAELLIWWGWVNLRVSWCTEWHQLRSTKKKISIGKNSIPVPRWNPNEFIEINFHVKRKGVFCKRKSEWINGAASKKTNNQLLVLKIYIQMKF